METPKQTLTYRGTDYWGRAVFQSDSGHYYKSVDHLDPDGGFPNADAETQEKILNDLYTCCPYDDFEGEPGWPISRAKFALA